MYATLGHNFLKKWQRTLSFSLHHFARVTIDQKVLFTPAIFYIQIQNLPVPILFIFISVAFTKV